MEEILTEIAKQVPSLAVLAFVVLKGAQALGKRDQFFKEIRDDYRNMQRESLQSLKDSTQVMSVATEIIKEYVEEKKIARMSTPDKR